ncbi:protein of unknown function [Alteromonadaceae bacterium Bs31]|nr:protein of unknown function [Alteromonadaceae bacterium Bs31]
MYFRWGIMRSITACTIFLLFASSTLAGVVKWKDENGVVHFGDRVPEKYREKAENVDLRNANAVSNDNQAPKQSRSKHPPRKSTNSQESSDEQTRQAKARFCMEAQQNYTDLTTVKHKYDRYSGGYTRTKTLESHVLKKDGTARKQGDPLMGTDIMTRIEQNRHTETLRKQWNAQGCSIAQTPNLQL